MSTKLLSIPEIGAGLCEAAARSGTSRMKIGATFVKLVQERIPERFRLDPIRDVHDNQAGEWHTVPGISSGTSHSLRQ